MTNRSKGNLLLLSAAAIWGFAFVAQRDGMNHLGPLIFNGIRFVLGAATVLIYLILRQGRSLKESFSSKTLLIHGLMAGIALFIASIFQQIGIKYTTAGNAGFITSLYIFFVPVIGLFRRLRYSWKTWAGALVAIPGLYLLSGSNGLNLQAGDLLVLISAVFWAFHLIILDQVAPRHDYRHLAFLQFSVAGLLSLVPGMIFELPSVGQLSAAWLPLLYTGIFSAGLGFTFQVAGQRHLAANHAALILSLEAVFALAGGYLLLHENMTLKQLLGASLMLTGVVFSQLAPVQKRN